METDEASALCTLTGRLRVQLDVAHILGLWPILIFAAYFAVMRWVLPRFGVET